MNLQDLFPYCIPDISQENPDKVEHLYLSIFAHVETVNISVLQPLTNLKTLFISDTKVIFDCDLSNWRLEYLYLYRCGLSEIPDVLLNIPYLKEIEFFGDSLSKVREDIYQMKSLRKLSIHSDLNISIPASVIYTELEEIHVSDCFPSSLNHILQISSLKIFSKNNEFYDKNERDIIYKNGFIINGSDIIKK